MTPRFLLIFFVVLLLLFTAELTTVGQQAFVIPFTSAVAKVSAFLMQLWDTHVAAHGKVIADAATGFAVSIESGCNGVEAGIVLVAAMVAFPAAWLDKLIGIIGGTVTIQVLNLVRIISLFYLGQWSRTAFEWAHLYLWQALIMLDVLVVFLVWLRWVSRRGDEPARAGEAA